MASLARLVTIAALLAAASSVLADCGDDPTDSQAVSAARAQAEARCDCATAPGHRRYVDCVQAAANEAVRAGLLPRRLPRRRRALRRPFDVRAARRDDLLPH